MPLITMLDAVPTTRNRATRHGFVEASLLWHGSIRVAYEDEHLCHRAQCQILDNNCVREGSVDVAVVVYDPHRTCGPTH